MAPQVEADGVGCMWHALSWSDVSLQDVHLRRFIIDGVITMPIALYGFLVFPDVPTTTKVFYLSDEVG